MKTALIAAIILLLAHAAFTQDENEQLTATGTISNSIGTSIFRNPPPMAIIVTDSGNVTINWSVVERIAADPSFYDKTLRAFAQVMLAIRDKTYIEIKDEPK